MSAALDAQWVQHAALRLLHNSLHAALASSTTDFCLQMRTRLWQTLRHLTAGSTRTNYCDDDKTACDQQESQ
jgi:hypothetical protein